MKSYIIFLTIFFCSIIANAQDIEPLMPSCTFSDPNFGFVKEYIVSSSYFSILNKYFEISGIEISKFE